MGWVTKSYQRAIESFTRRTDSTKSFGDFVHSIKERRLNRLEKVYGSRYDSNTVTKAGTLGETSGSIGGYTVPIEFSFQIMQCLVESSFIYPRANVIPMTSLVTQCPIIDAETVQSAGTFATVGGILLQWGTHQKPYATNPAFRQVNLTAWDLLGITTISNQMLADTGPNGESALAEMFGRAGAAYAEYAFINGTGTDDEMPLGILNAPGTVTVTRQTNSEITGTDVSNMASSMLPSGWGSTLWACSPTAVAQVTQISGFVPNMGFLPNMSQPGGVGILGYLFGQPVFVTEKLSSLGNTGDIMFIDPWMYVIGCRQEVLVDVSDQQLFQTAQTMFRIWLRMDGKPLNSKPITLVDGETQASPFVILGQAA